MAKNKVEKSQSSSNSFKKSKCYNEMLSFKKGASWNINQMTNTKPTSSSKTVQLYAKEKDKKMCIKQAIPD